MTRSRVTVALLAVLTLLVIATAGIVTSFSPPVRTKPVAFASPDAISASDHRFYQALAPALGDAAGEARELTRLGEERSRNLFAIRAGQSRLEGHLQTLDGLLGDADVPARFSDVAAAYLPAAATVREAMAAAEAAFLRFDWEGVGAATERMAEGTRQLEAAVAELDQANT